MTLALILLSILTVGILTSLILVVVKLTSRSDSQTREMISTVMESNRRAAVASQLSQSEALDTIKGITSNQTDLVERLILGRELPENLPQQEQQPPKDREPIPGLETFDGLPEHIVEAINREILEEANSQPVLSRQPPIDFGGGSATEETAIQPS